MSTKAGNNNKANATGGDDDGEREGGLVPAILAGAGILAVVGLLVFWPSGDDEDKGKKGGKDKVADGRKAAAGAAGRNGGKGASAQGGGGVGARAVDAATPGASATKGKVNPKVLPTGMGMAPGVPVEEPPPKFKNVEDEIAWYETKLDKANEMVESRQKNVERLAKAKQKAEDSPDPGPAMAKYESSKRIVEANLAKAEAKVSEIEKKLADLRGE
ncbi:MAG: hypothetical protein AAGA54_16665 [Myxococcota bacterium]